MAYADPEDRRRYHRAYMAELRKWRTAHGLCRSCGGEDAYTMAGRCYCAACAEMHNASDRARRRADPGKSARERQRLQEARRLRREQGLCTTCGRERVDKRYLTCAKCRARDRRKHERKRREQGILPKSMYAELGLCANCGKRPPIPGETAWHGEPIKLCRACYDATMQAAARGRESYRAQNGETWGQRQYEIHRRLKSARESENMERFLHRPIL